MLTVLIGNSITIEWTVKGVSLADGQSRGGLFVYSGIDRRPLAYDVVASEGDGEQCKVTAVLDTRGFFGGVYSLELAYTKFSEGYAEFSEVKEYQPGAVVRYGDLLYEFVREHKGTWDSRDVKPLAMRYGRVKWRHAFALTNDSSAVGGDSVLTGESDGIVVGADGLTAYELAVLHGYTKNEVDYAEQYIDAVERARANEKAIADEVARATEREDELQDDIDGNTEAIRDEVARATEVERGLSDRIDSIENNGVDLIEVEKAIADEVKRATEAEAALWVRVDSVGELATINNGILVEQGKNIDALMAQHVLLELSISPSVIHKNENTNINLSSRFLSELDADAKADIKLYKDGEVVMRETASNIAYTDIANTDVDIVYIAETIYKGKTLTASKTLKPVDPIYIGGGSDYSEIMDDAHRLNARLSVAGTYTVILSSAGYVWIVVPKTIGMVNKAVMNGFDFPLTQQEDDSNHIYRSASQLVKGSYTITLS